MPIQTQNLALIRSVKRIAEGTRSAQWSLSGLLPTTCLPGQQGVQQTAHPLPLLCPLKCSLMLCRRMAFPEVESRAYFFACSFLLGDASSDDSPGLANDQRLDESALQAPEPSGLRISIPKSDGSELAHESAASDEELRDADLEASVLDVLTDTVLTSGSRSVPSEINSLPDIPRWISLGLLHPRLFTT